MTVPDVPETPTPDPDAPLPEPSAPEPPTPEPEAPTPEPPTPDPEPEPEPTPEPEPEPAPPASLSIAEAAAAALAEHEAEQAAEAEAERAQLLEDAREALSDVLGPRVDVAALPAQVLDGGSVVVTQGSVSLSVDPQGRVWLVREVNGRWQHPGKPVASLVDIARALKAG